LTLLFPDPILPRERKELVQPERESKAERGKRVVSERRRIRYSFGKAIPFHSPIYEGTVNTPYS